MSTEFSWVYNEIIRKKFILKLQLIYKKTLNFAIDVQHNSIAPYWSSSFDTICRIHGLITHTHTLIHVWLCVKVYFFDFLFDAESDEPFVATQSPLIYFNFRWNTA